MPSESKKDAEIANKFSKVYLDVSKHHKASYDIFGFEKKRRSTTYNNGCLLNEDVKLQ